MTRSRQVVFPRVGVIEIEEVEVPALAAGEVLVRVRRVGVCATDLHLLDGHIGDPFPLVPGHEFVGEVAGLGAPERPGLALGDRVAVEMLLPCASCARCREGRYNLCERDLDPLSPVGRQLGVNIPRTAGSGLSGGCADHLLAPREAVVHRLPADLDWDAAALVEPLAVAFRALHRGRLAPGDDVAVVGPGPVGLLVAAAARACGAGRVAVVGTRAERLALAGGFGADLTVDARSGDPRGQLLERLGHLPDLVVETAGTPAAQASAVRAVRRGGRVVLAGACGAGASLELDPDGDLLTREIDLLPSFLSAGGYEPAISLLSRPGFDVSALVTHRFGLEEVARAYDLVRERADGVLKALLVP